MDYHELIDTFVATVNAAPGHRDLADDVPIELRYGPPDETYGDLRPNWRIISSDHSARITALEQRMAHQFPPSFRSLVCRYSYPAFEFGPVTFFANTGRDTWWELERRLFLDPIMSPLLLDADYIQIGNPLFGHYDPVCIHSGPHAEDGPVVALDHEDILTEKRLSVVMQIAPSFADLVKSLVARRVDA
jgi:hypothetical protein